MTAAEQAAAVRAGEVSARELVDAAFAAIERVDPELNAFVTLCPERARAEADAVRPGDERALAGVPIAIKDAFCHTEGLLTTFGSRALGDWVPDRDSPVVARLRAAGAIVVGKTNTPELAGRPVTEPERFGPTRNPWAPALSPGGSSGGSAAAVAAGLVALAHGNDFSGSIRIPASACGVIGLKPCGMRVPVEPAYAATAGSMCVDGVLTRTVRDTALALDVISGPAPGDAWWPEPPAGSFQTAAERAPGPLSVIVCRRPPLGQPVDPVCGAAVEGAADLLAGLGHEVTEDVPDWEDPHFYEHWDVLLLGAVRHLVDAIGRARGSALDPQDFEPGLRSAFDAPPLDTRRFDAASDAVHALARRILAWWPPGAVLLTPTLSRLPAAVGKLDPGDGTRFGDFTRWWNLTGQPAISLPLAEADGVPVGVQLVGPPMGEELLLSLAAQIEDAIAWRPHGEPALSALVPA